MIDRIFHVRFGHEPDYPVQIISIGVRETASCYIPIIGTEQPDGAYFPGRLHRIRKDDCDRSFAPYRPRIYTTRDKAVIAMLDFLPTLAEEERRIAAMFSSLRAFRAEEGV